MSKKVAFYSKLFSIVIYQTLRVILKNAIILCINLLQSFSCTYYKYTKFCKSKNSCAKVLFCYAARRNFI